MQLCDWTYLGRKLGRKRSNCRRFCCSFKEPCGCIGTFTRLPIFTNHEKHVREFRNGGDGDASGVGLEEGNVQEVEDNVGTARRISQYESVDFIFRGNGMNAEEINSKEQHAFYKQVRILCCPLGISLVYTEVGEIVGRR